MLVEAISVGFSVGFVFARSLCSKIRAGSTSVLIYPHIGLFSDGDSWSSILLFLLFLCAIFISSTMGGRGHRSCTRQYRVWFLIPLIFFIYFYATEVFRFNRTGTESLTVLDAGMRQYHLAYLLGSFLLCWLIQIEMSSASISSV